MGSIQSADRDLEGSARSLIDHLLFRVGELILLVVALLIVVRAVLARTQPRSRARRRMHQSRPSPDCPSS